MHFIHNWFTEQQQRALTQHNVFTSETRKSLNAITTNEMWLARLPARSLERKIVCARTTLEGSFAAFFKESKRAT
jgi:hypothetical protein